jgi:hypothetical protein
VTLADLYAALLALGFAGLVYVVVAHCNFKRND